MDAVDGAALFAQAVGISRAVSCPEDYDAVWDVLRRVAVTGPAAVRLARDEVSSADATVRATACDLLGVASEVHEEVRESAASVLVSLAATEVDGDVQWSIARALGTTNDARAVPILVALAGHADADVRFQVALSLPEVLGDGPAGAGVAALIDLCGDPDEEVRNWATFGLGWQSTADGAVVRQALWQRTADSYDEAREEGIRGLARRRDRRAVPLLAGLLAAEHAHVHTFEAAAFLGHPSLLPLLAPFDPADLGVAEALLECDPPRRARRDAAALDLFDALHARRPDLEIAMYGQRFELGLRLEVINPPGACWSVEALLDRAGGDPDRAAQLAAEAMV